MAFVVPEWLKADWDTVEKEWRTFPATGPMRYKMKQTQEYDLGYIQGRLSGMHMAIINLPKEEK